MLKRYRKPVIAGNWKMNTRPSEVEPFLIELTRDMPKDRPCEVIICPPYPLIPAVAAHAKACRIDVGAQNVSQFVSGAHTGEVSLAMLEDLGVRYVILGHSERRADNGETDFLVNAVSVPSTSQEKTVYEGKTAAERFVGEFTRLHEARKAALRVFHFAPALFYEQVDIVEGLFFLAGKGAFHRFCGTHLRAGFCTA